MQFCDRRCSISLICFFHGYVIDFKSSINSKVNHRIRSAENYKQYSKNNANTLIDETCFFIITNSLITKSHYNYIIKHRYLSNVFFTWISTCLCLFQHELCETHNNLLIIPCCSLFLWYANSFFCDGEVSDITGGGKAAGRNKVLKVLLLEVASSECSI